MSDNDSIGLLGVYIEGDAPRCQTISPVPFTNRSWAELVLMNLGAPLTTNNIDNILRWMVGENYAKTWWGTAGKNNPLNNGEGSGGGLGLGSYPDLSAAAYWVAENIDSGPFHAQYSAIRTALMNNASPADFSTAVVQSPWAGGHYGVAAAGAGSYTVPGRGLNYLATIPVPPEVTAPIANGANLSGSNGVGWAFVNPQVWDPKVGPLPPGVDSSHPAATPIILSQLPASAADMPVCTDTSSSGNPSDCSDSSCDCSDSSCDHGGDSACDCGDSSCDCSGSDCSDSSCDC